MSREPQNEKPIVIDFFAGAGGLSLGLEQAGFEIKASVEIDPIHCATHKYNFPKCQTICASVTDLTGDQVRSMAKIGDQDIDLVCGGAPCQGFSLIGKRALDDPRNELVFHFVRLVDELSPKYFLFENVKGLTVGKHKKFVEELILAFELIGYKMILPYQVLNAKDFGVPQDRQRFFLIGCRDEQKLCSYPAGSESVTVSEALSDLPNADDFQELTKSDKAYAPFQTKSKYARQLRGLLSDPSDFSDMRNFDKHLLTSSLKTEHSTKSKTRFEATQPGQTEPVSRYKKLALEGVCNTLRAGTDSARGAFTSPRPIHPIYTRVITVREAARLHSYPDWFRFHWTKWHGFRQIGNSVPPKLGRAIGKQIIEALDYSPRKGKPINPGAESLLYLDMKQAASMFDVPPDTIAQRKRA